MSILNKHKVGGRSCDLLTPYVCLGDPDLTLASRVKTPYEPVGRIEDLSHVELLAKQKAVQKRKKKLEEQKLKEMKEKEAELMMTPIKITKSNANLYKRQKRYNLYKKIYIFRFIYCMNSKSGYHYLNLAVNESNRRVKATKSGAVLPDLHRPPEREPLIPPSVEEFLPEVNKSKDIKSVCHNYEAPVPIYLSYGNMKENSCPLFLLSLPNYAQIINDKKVFKNYYCDDDEDEEGMRYPDISIIEDVLYDITPYVGICSKWLYENIDSRVVELYEENNIIRRENEYYKIPKYNEKDNNKNDDDSKESDFIDDETEDEKDGDDKKEKEKKEKEKNDKEKDRKKDDDDDDDDDDEDEKSDEKMNKKKKKNSNSDSIKKGRKKRNNYYNYNNNNNNNNNNLMFSPIQSADRKLLRIRSDLPQLQTQMNDVMTKKLEYIKHNRNLINQYKYMELDNLPPIKDPMKSIKVIRNDVERRRLLLIQSSFKQIIMYKRLLLFIILSFPKRNTLWPINVAFVAEYIKRCLQDGVEINEEIIFKIIDKLPSEALSDPFMCKMLRYIGELFGIDENDIEKRLL